MDTPSHPIAYAPRMRLGMALAMFLLAWLLQALPLVTQFERTLYDLRVRLVARGNSPIDDLMMVVIDDRSVEAFAEDAGGWPWPRIIQAHLVDYLSQARVIGMDVLLPEETWVVDSVSRGDEEPGHAGFLSSNMVSAVLFTADSSYRASPVPPDFARMAITADDAALQALPGNNHVIAPFPALLEASHAIGDVQIKHDPDGTVRSCLAATRYHDRVYPSLALAIAGQLAGVEMGDIRLENGRLHLGLRSFPLAPDGSFLFLEPDQSYPSIRASDVINSCNAFRNGEKPEYPPEYFRDKIVLIGATARTVRDGEMTPLRASTSGTFIHACAVDNLLNGVCLRGMSSLPVVALMFLLAVLPAAVPIARPRHLIMMGVVAPLVLLVPAVALAFAHVIPPMVGPMLAVGLPFTGLGMLGRARERSHCRYVASLDLAKQQFIDMLVHELKNTVSPIIMSLPMIGLGRRRSGEVDEAFLHEDFPEIVFTSANKLMTQVNALLDTRRLQEGRMRLHPEPCSPRELLERTKQECEIPIRRAELRLEVVHQAAGDVRVRVDPAVFDRILGNVVWNAVKYAAQASTIRLGSRLADDGRLCIYVANQGKVIPEEVKANLFSVFMTGPGSGEIRGSIPATGIGLTFCKLALEAHCCEIDLLSPAPDSEGGIEVRLLIPICDIPAD